MAFKVQFWNIENFTDDDPTRIELVANHILATSPDIVGFSEIKDKNALRTVLFERLSDYDFGITDGDQQIELVAGWKRGVFGQALFTQRREFKAGNTHLRPGSLLSIQRSGTFYNFLFLHTDSGRKHRDYQNRQDMFERMWDLRERLSQIEETNSRFIIMGDLNTMGRSAAGQAPEISGDDEVAALTADAQNHGMVLLAKDHPFTWADVDETGAIVRQSNLDHAIVSDSVTLASNIAAVRGWPELSNDAERFTFVEHISDHASVEIDIEEDGM